MIEGLRRAIAEFDEAVDHAFDHLRGRRWADRVFYTASDWGDFSKIWHVTGSVRALLPDRTWRSGARLAVALGAESLLVNGLVKSIVRRERPVSVEPRPLHLRQPLTSSFPSGHASSAFMAATLLSERDRRIAPFYFAMATVVATSRIHVRIHHGSDVAAGAVLGLTLGQIVRRVAPFERFR